MLFCLNPVLINYSFEFKPYILDVFCALSALWIFLNTDFQTNSAKKVLVYGCLLAILPWFSFMSTMVIFAGFMALSFKRENPKNFFLMFLPIFLSAFLYLKLYVLNAYGQSSAGMIGFWQNEFQKILWLKIALVSLLFVFAPISFYYIFILKKPDPFKHYYHHIALAICLLALILAKILFLA